MGRLTYEKKINNWLDGNLGRLYRFRSGLLGIFHNKIPRKFRILGVTHWGAKTSMASSAPVVLFYYGTIPGLTAAVAAGAIFFGHFIISLLDQISKDKATSSEEFPSGLFVRFGDLLNSLTTRSTEAAHRDDAVRSCLGILEIFARQVTRSRKGDISVSVLLYPDADSSTSRMSIRHRNPGNERPTNRIVDSARLFGHHACQRDRKPRIVHDTNYFGPEGTSSPTQSSVKYRSIFVIPIQKSSGDGPKKSGFVSIDSTRPYAFYGNRANRIIVDCEPVLNHIQELI